MTEDTSPENLRKFLESDDPALVKMGISLAKGAGVEVTIKDLERFLKSGDVETVKNGVILADEAGIGAEAVRMLCEPLGDENYEVRKRAAKVLGEIGDVRAVEPLIRVLEVEEFRGWGTAVWALGKIGDARAVEPLIKVLKDENAEPFKKSYHANEKIYAIANALGEIGDVRAVEPLIEILRDSELGDLRQCAAVALGKIDDARVVGPLIKALEDDGYCFDGSVAETAKEALKKLGHEVE
jgi:HEAT repeat protein